MKYAAYLRDQAIKYRQLAEEEESVWAEIELLDLAAVCEEVANGIEDRQASG